jgi:hypothetical protein
VTTREFERVLGIIREVIAPDCVGRPRRRAQAMPAASSRLVDAGIAAQNQRAPAKEA